MTLRSEVLFKSKSVEPPELLTILGALEEYRVQAGIHRIELICSEVMRNLAIEFRYNSINCLVDTNFDAISPAVDIDELSRVVKDFDPLNTSLSSRLRKICESQIGQEASRLPLDNPFSFDTFTRLGDSISIISGIEAYCIANNIEQVVLVANGSIKDVVENFSTPHIRLIEQCNKASPQLERLYRQASWLTPWLKRFSNEIFLTYGGVLPTVVSPLSLKYEIPIDDELKDVIYCQFDSRSHSIESIPAIVQQLSHLFAGRRIRVIGGRETTQYLGNMYSYDLGDLREIIVRLGNCSCFLGCDSGIAHLAGILGKPSVIVNFSEFESVYNFFRSYPNSVVVNRKLLEMHLNLKGLSI